MVHDASCLVFVSPFNPRRLYIAAPSTGLQSQRTFLLCLSIWKSPVSAVGHMLLDQILNFKTTMHVPPPKGEALTRRTSRVPKRVRFADQLETSLSVSESGDSVSTWQLGTCSRSESSTLPPLRSFGRDEDKLKQSDVELQSAERAEDSASLHESSARGKGSFEIVPYTGKGAVVQPHGRRFLALFAQHNEFDTPLLSKLPRTVMMGEAGPPCGGEGLPRGVRLEERKALSTGSGFQLGSVVPRWNTVGDQELHRSKWMIVSREQVEQTAQKMHDQAETNKVLETKVKRHKRERVLLYDAAMKQVAKREEKAAKEMKQVLERQQNVMREEVDHELHKINQLYQQRCVDYATMVSDECEREVSKAAADLRKDWARQKKTIDQLVRSGGEEDRQVSVIARAVIQQLEEERKDEIAMLRADIYSDVKKEFESREVTLRDTLESEFQADLDGRLLLAEIKHQKEMDQLRVGLGGGKVADGGAANNEVVSHNTETPQREGKAQGRSGSPSFAQSPLFSRRPLEMVNNGAGAEGNSGAGGVGGAATPRRKLLGRKFPVFRTPVQKLSPDASDHEAESRVIGATTTPIRQHDEESELDVGITGTLMVSPTKAIPGVVTLSIGAEAAVSGDEPSRPNKRAKRLFKAVGP